MLTAYAATSDTAEQTTSELTHLIELVITKIPLWIAAFIVIILSVIVAKISRRVIENKLAEKGIEEEHKELQILSGRLAYSGVLTLGVTAGLKIAGIDLTTIIAAVAFGIGFALKDLIMNFLAGVLILVGRHFSIGDFIKIGSTVGKVEEIQSRVTILKAIDGTKVIVPNAELFKKQVISFTSNPFRRIELKIRVDYRNNLENVLNICIKVLENTKGILVQPKFAVVVDEFTENGISIKIKAWVDSKGGWVKVKSRLAKNLKNEFDTYGIKIPWPIRTIIEDKENKLSEKIMEEAKEESKKTSIPQAALPTTPLQVAPAPTPAPAVPQATEPQPIQPLPVAAPDMDQPLKPLGDQP